VETTRQRVHDLIADEGEAKMSISGVQPKALMRVNEAGELVVVGAGSTHILKPPSDRFGHLPANEHVTMLVGRWMGLDVPPCGLLRLADGQLVYIVRRFDRNGAKKSTNDFCQLLEVPPEEKSRGKTAEQCAEAVRRYCDPAASSLERLFRLLVVAYLFHNGDLHLKNLSIIEDAAGRWGLSPAYDLVNTSFYERDRWNSTLSVGGEKRDISRKLWLTFGESCGLTPGRSAAMLDEILARSEGARRLILRSFLPPEWQDVAVHLLEKRCRSLRSSFGKRADPRPGRRG
jgi:serine/threonine-protein kinase HipA